MITFSIYGADRNWVDTRAPDQLQNASWSLRTGVGYGEFSGRIQRKIVDEWIVRSGYWLVARDGLKTVYEGQLVDIARSLEAETSLVDLSASGPYLALGRRVLQRFYVDPRNTKWTYPQVASESDQKYAFDNSEQLRIGAKAEAVFGTADIGRMTYTSGKNGADPIRHIAGTVTLITLGQNWTFGFYDQDGVPVLTWNTDQAAQSFSTAIGGTVTRLKLQLVPGTVQMARPLAARVFTYINGTYYDWSQVAIREGANDIAGGPYVGGLPGTANAGTAYVYVGGVYPYENIHVPVGRHTNAQASTLYGQYWNGAAWVALPQFRDTTTNGGTTLAQSGDWSFSRPADWARTAVNGSTALWTRWYWSHRVYPGTAVARRIAWIDANGGGLHNQRDLPLSFDEDLATKTAIWDSDASEPFQSNDHMLWGFTDRICGWYVNLDDVQTAAALINSVYVSGDGIYESSQESTKMFLSTLVEDLTVLSGKSMGQDGYIFVHGDPRWRQAEVAGYGYIYYTRFTWNADWSGTSAADAPELIEVWPVPDIGLGLVTLGASPDTPIAGKITGVEASYFSTTPVHSDDVIQDLLAEAGLSTDYSRIEDPGFAIQDFVMDPWETLDSGVRRLAALSDSQLRPWYLNVYHGLGYTSDGLPRAEFIPRDVSIPVILVDPQDADSGFHEEELGDTVINFLVVEYTNEKDIVSFVTGDDDSSLKDQDSIDRHGPVQRVISVGHQTRAQAIQLGAAYISYWAEPKRRVTARLRGLIPVTGGGKIPASWVHAGMAARRLDVIDDTDSVFWIADAECSYEDDAVTITSEVPEDNLTTLLAAMLTPSPTIAGPRNARR